MIGKSNSENIFVVTISIIIQFSKYLYEVKNTGISQNHVNFKLAAKYKLGNKDDKPKDKIIF